MNVKLSTKLGGMAPPGPPLEPPLYQESAYLGVSF